jgi:hypothetical protein
MELADIIAIIGVSLLLLAFFLQTLKIIKTESLTYSLLNFIGAGIAGYASLLIPFIPFVVLEGAWCLVALVSIIKLLNKNRVSRGA